MKKILYITFKSPYPDDAGYPIRALNVGRALAQRYEVDLLFLTDGKVGPTHLEVLQKTFHRVIPFTFPRTRLLFNGVFGVMSKLPLQVEYFYNHIVREWVRDNYHKYDLLFCSTIRTTEYVRGLNRKKAVDLIDDFTLSYGEFLPIAPYYLKPAYLIDWLRVKRYHRAILHQFDRVFLVSNFDAQHLNLFLETPLSSITVLPNGARDELFVQSGPPLEEKSNSIVIFGSMNYLPNRDGALFFAREIFSDLKKRFPNLELKIIGKHPPRTLKQMRGRGIHALGFVDDPYTHIQQGTIVVSPLRAGAGIPNKILEAMALKKANVISPVAARGLEGDDGKHYLVAKNKKEWIDTVSTLLRDPSLRKRLGEEAYRLVQDKYRWDRITRTLLSETEKIFE